MQLAASETAAATLAAVYLFQIVFGVREAHAVLQRRAVRSWMSAQGAVVAATATTNPAPRALMEKQLAQAFADSLARSRIRIPWYTRETTSAKHVSPHVKTEVRDLKSQPLRPGAHF